MSRDIRSLIVLPTLLFMLFSSALALANGDLLLGDFLYGLQSDSWALRTAWVTNDLVHDQGRNMVGLVLLLLLAAIAMSHLHDSVRPYRKGLYYVLTSALITVAIVNLMKEYTGVDCPWDLARYGGEQTYVSLFGTRPAGQEPGRCFPAGHASGAYCWLGLFFLAKRYRPQWRFGVLAGVLGLGLIFGVAQQLRGAHFLSHDIWTVYISWMSAALCYYSLFRMERTQRADRTDDSAM